MLDVLTTRVNEAEERGNNIEEKLIERKGTDKKREKQLLNNDEVLGKSLIS